MPEDEPKTKLSLSTFRHPVQLRKCTETSINVVGDLIVRGNLIKYLGVWMDEMLTFKQHITKK